MCQSYLALLTLDSKFKIKYVLSYLRKKYSLSRGKKHTTGSTGVYLYCNPFYPEKNHTLSSFSYLSLLVLEMLMFKEENNP